MGHLPGGNPFPLQVPSNARPLRPRSSIRKYAAASQPDLYAAMESYDSKSRSEGSWLLSGGYLGNETVHMWVVYDENPAVYMPGASCVINGTTYTPCSSTTNANQHAVATESGQGKYFSASIRSMTVGRRATTGCCSPAPAPPVTTSRYWRITPGRTVSTMVRPTNLPRSRTCELETGESRSRRLLCLCGPATDPEYLGRSPNAKFSDHMLRVMASGWQLSTIVTLRPAPQ